MKKRDDRKRRKDLRPKAQWPRKWPLVLTDHDAFDRMRPEELRALVMHPMVTGLGKHPRRISDEDYFYAQVHTAEMETKFAQWVFDLVHILRQTIGMLYDQDFPDELPMTNYPTSKHPEFKLPMPDVAAPSDREWNETSRWTARMVRGMMISPTLVGMGPFPQRLPLMQWVRTVVALGKKEGILYTAVNMIYVTRHMIGYAGSPELRGVLVGPLAAVDPDDKE
jgi:hypothetical protein